MNMNKVFCFGMSGGCLDAFYLYKEIYKNTREVFFLSNQHSVGDVLFDHIVSGPFEFINNSKIKGTEFIYQCGSSDNHISRNVWFDKAIMNGMRPITLISSLAYVHESVSVGEGTIIYPGAKIMANVNIGKNCIILPNAVISHDSIIGDFTIINSSCVINGNVKIGKNCYIGSSTSVKENVRILSKSTIGMCSLILDSIDKKGLYFGSPAKFIR